MSYKNKFKDRVPNETVKIIKDFFTNKGYTIKETMLKKTDIGTYVLGLELIFENELITRTVGKGISEDYCRASGYAEMYERFCNKSDCVLKPFFMQRLMTVNKSKYNYYLSNEEKILSFNEVINENRFNELFNLVVTPENNDRIEQIYKKIFGNFVGVPFKNVNNKYSKNVKYLDPRLLFFISGTNGMSAGNTVEEALVQGISEMCERHVMVDLFINKNIRKEKFFYINLNTIQNKELNIILNKLKTKGNDVYIFDLSYNYNLPVIATLVVNKLTNTFDINYSSHPIFDIALERTLTELYQSDNYEKYIGESINAPSMSSDITDVLRDTGTNIKKYFPEFLLINSFEVDEYNTKIFWGDGDYDNKKLYERQIQLLELQKLQLYYYNSSMCQELFSVHLYSPNMRDLGMNVLKKYFYEPLSIEKCYSIEKFLNVFYEVLIKGNVKKGKKLLDQFSKTLNLWSNSFYLDLFGCTDIMSLYYKNNCLNMYELIYLFDDFENIYNCFSDTFFNKHIKLVLLIKMYKQSKKYSEKEIIKLFSYMGVDKKFIKDCDIIVDGILKPYYEEYNSERYQKYCETYCKD